MPGGVRHVRLHRAPIFWGPRICSSPLTPCILPTWPALMQMVKRTHATPLPCTKQKGPQHRGVLTPAACQFSCRASSSNPVPIHLQFLFFTSHDTKGRAVEADARRQGRQHRVTAEAMIASSRRRRGAAAGRRPQGRRRIQQRQVGNFNSSRN